MAIEWDHDIVLVRLADEPRLSEELCELFGRLSGEAGPTKVKTNVVIDFTDVSYLNSSHIAALLRLRKRQAESGGKVVLCCMGDDLWSTMLLTGLDKVFTFAPDTVTAIAGIQVENEPGS